MASFVDHVTLHLRAGNGGNGCVSVRRESRPSPVQTAATVATAVTLCSSVTRGSADFARIPPCTTPFVTKRRIRHG